MLPCTRTVDWMRSHRKLTRAFCTAAAINLGALGAHAHDPTSAFSYGNVSYGSSLPEEARVYYLDLFTHVAEKAALANWPKLLLSVAQLSANVLSQSEAEAVYGTLAATLPVVHVQWTGATSTLVSAPALTMAVGVERCVLVEIDNASGAPDSFQIQFPGKSPSNVAWIPAGAKGTVAVAAEVNQLSATQLALEVALRVGQIEGVAHRGGLLGRGRVDGRPSARPLGRAPLCRTHSY